MILSPSWFTEPEFDFEHKKYQLLAYLQHKNRNLEEQKIYPHLDELNLHEQILLSFLRTKNELDAQFRKELTGMDLIRFELKYETREIDEENMGVLSDIVLYAVGKMKKCRLRFEEQAEELKRKIHVELAGLIPVYLKQGFLIVFRKQETDLFSYEVCPLLDAKGNIRFQYRFLQEYPNEFLRAENRIKADIRNRFSQSNYSPAVFSVSTDRELPVYETILPLVSAGLKKWVG
jgi:hypothetical protein